MAKDDDDPGRTRTLRGGGEAYQRPGVFEWPCGHTAGAVCAECAAKANELAEEIERLREVVRVLQPLAARASGPDED